MQSRLGDSGLLGFWETIQQLQAGESRVQNKSLSKVNFLGIYCMAISKELLSLHRQYLLEAHDSPGREGLLRKEYTPNNMG